MVVFSVVDLAFPIGEGVDPLGGMWTPDVGTFWQNVCKNERIGSHGGRGHAPDMPPRSTNVFCTYFTMNIKDVSLKPYYDADLTISRSQYGGFSTSGLV